MKTPENILKSQRAYRKRNKKATRIRSYRTTARMFIKKYATHQDLVNVVRDVKHRDSGVIKEA